MLLVQTNDHGAEHANEFLLTAGFTTIMGKIAGAPRQFNNVSASGYSQKFDFSQSLPLLSYLGLFWPLLDPISQIVFYTFLLYPTHVAATARPVANLLCLIERKGTTTGLPLAVPYVFFYPILLAGAIDSPDTRHPMTST